MATDAGSARRPVDRAANAVDALIPFGARLRYPTIEAVGAVVLEDALA